MRWLFTLTLAAMPLLAQADVTGNWSGTYTFSVQLSGCSNKTFTASGNASMNLLQTGTAVSGRLDVANFVTVSSNCTAGTTELVRVVVGTANGNAIALSVPNSPAGTRFEAVVDGNTLNAQWSDANGATGTLTLTRTAGDAPTVDTTGTWSGTYNFTDVCPNGRNLAYNGALTLELTQSGTTAAGVAVLKNVPLYDQNCATLANLDQAMAVTGTVSGSTFTGGAYDPSGLFEFPITATVNGTSITGSVTGANETSTTGSFTATQSSAVVPASDLTGNYEGTYNESDNETSTCINIGVLQFSGTASLTLLQGGSDVAGWLTFHDAQSVVSDPFGDCAVVGIGDDVLPVYGTLSNNTLSFTAPVGSVAARFVLTFAGSVVNGSIADTAGDSATFIVTKTSVPSVTVDSFKATPAAIVGGQQVTLSWATTNATSVTIDNGVGSQPPSGSIVVTPAQTTTYTLTASNSGGTATSQVTVSVSPAKPKRRATRP